jgi:hydrogenase maturation protease
MSSRVVIIACGNTLRSDDGIAWRAAEALEKKFPAEQVEILRVHQLAPEIAECISRSRRVIFLDAATSDQGKPGEIRMEHAPRNTATSSSGFCHAFSPRQALALAEQLYGGAPDAYFVSMIGENFSHGESLSGSVASSMPKFIAGAERLIEECLREESKLVNRESH